MTAFGRVQKNTCKTNYHDRHFCVAVKHTKLILGHKASHLEVCKGIQSILHLALNFFGSGQRKAGLVGCSPENHLAGVQKQVNLVKNIFVYKTFKIFVVLTLFDNV